MTGSLEDMWNRRFVERPWPGDPDPYLLELAQPLQPGRGLDLGSGPGRNSLWLAGQGWDMTLVDVSSVGLDQAVTSAAAAKVTVTTVHADAYTWQPEADFDLVIVANLHPAPVDLAVLLAHAASALRVGGHLYVVGHHVTSLGRRGPPDPDKLFTPERIRAALPPSLDVEVVAARPRTPNHEHREGQPNVDTVVLAWATKLPH